MKSFCISISPHTAQALSAALTKIESYIPTTWVDYTEPDIDAEHLNHAEQAIMRVTVALNAAADVINALVDRVAKNEEDIGLLNAHMDNALAYSIYGKILEGNATLNITVQVNSTFLVFVSNAYNNGAFYMLCTGHSVEKCVLIPIVANSYFTLEPVGIDTFKISSGNANGRIYVIHIGAAY